MQRGGKKAEKIYCLDYCLTEVRVLREHNVALLASKLSGFVHSFEVKVEFSS